MQKSISKSKWIRNSMRNSKYFFVKIAPGLASNTLTLSNTFEDSIEKY